MKCGKRKAKGIYSRKEIEELVKERLGLGPTEIRKRSKRELCQAIGISWVEEEATTSVVVSTDKVCSDRKSKTYPLRYSKEELIDMIKSRNPFYNKARLRRMTFSTLCRIANLPYIKTMKEHEIREVRRVNNKERFYNKVAREEKASVAATRPCIERSRRPPFQYQQRVVEHLGKHRGLIAIHSLGSGKTMTAILASQCYLDSHPLGKVVVISPTSLIGNFKKEMDQFGELRHGDRYEFFSFQGFFSKYKDNPRQCKNHLLIIDEAHNLRTSYHKSARGKETGKITKIITQCAENANRVLLLTATPLINDMKDIASLLNMVRDNPTIDNEITRKNFKPRNDEYLRRVGMCKFSFYERDRLNQDYPQTIYKDIYLIMKPQFYTMYRKVEAEVMDEDIMRTFGNESKLKPFYNGIRRAVNILSELPEEDMIKSEKIRWIIDNLRTNSHKKTVIFSHFLESGVEAIQNKIKKEFPQLEVSYITGSQPKRHRSEIVSQFNRDELNVLFISKAGGEGLDLKGTRQIILMESGWNENTERQVIGRGVRFHSHSHLPSAEQNVTIYRLYNIKKDENAQHILSSDYIVNYKDVSTWPSADLLLKKISNRKHKKTERFLQTLKNLSIEHNNIECNQH